MWNRIKVWGKMCDVRVKIGGNWCGFWGFEEVFGVLCSIFKDFGI